MLGTDNGKIQLFEVGELKNEFSISVKPGSSMQSPMESSRKTL